MGTGAKPAKLNTPAQNLHCVASFPKVHLSALMAKVSSFDRRGAVIHLFRRDLQGRTIEAQDSVLLEVGLPPNQKFGRRAMHCVGKATHVSDSIDGSIWLTVRFQQLYFQQIEPGAPDEADSVSPRRGNRGQTAGGTENGAVNGSINS